MPAERLKFDNQLCCECGACVAVCAFEALVLKGWGLEIVTDNCTLCEACLPTCPTGCLSLGRDDG